MDAGRDAPVASPCVYVCALDDDDICLGCQRSGEEITRWGRMDDTERRAVLARCTAGLWRPDSFRQTHPL